MRLPWVFLARDRPAARRLTVAGALLLVSRFIVVLVFIILDRDRLRRGLIEVSQTSLVDLQLPMRR